MEWDLNQNIDTPSQTVKSLQHQAFDKQSSPCYCWPIKGLHKGTYLRWSAQHAETNFSAIPSKSFPPKPYVPRLEKNLSAMRDSGWLSSEWKSFTSDDGDNTGSMWRTVTAKLVSLILILVTSGHGSSRAAIPARPGFADGTVCLGTVLWGASTCTC